MLDKEARTLLDLMEQAVQAGRPRLDTLPYAQGRTAVDKMSEDSEAEPPEVDAVNARFDYLNAKAQIEALIGRQL